MLFFVISSLSVLDKTVELIVTAVVVTSKQRVPSFELHLLLLWWSFQSENDSRKNGYVVTETDVCGYFFFIPDTKLIVKKIANVQGYIYTAKNRTGRPRRIWVVSLGCFQTIYNANYNICVEIFTYLINFMRTKVMLCGFFTFASGKFT